MTYHELITAQRETKRSGKTYTTVDYKDLAMESMSDVFFTTEEIIKKYPNVVQAVVTGKYKGFKWALENPGETFEILKKITDGLDLSREMDAVEPMKALMSTADTKKQGFRIHSTEEVGTRGEKRRFKAGLLDKMPDVKRACTEKFQGGVTQVTRPITSYETFGGKRC